MRCTSQLAAMVMCVVLMSGAAMAQDVDQDQIPDMFERRLINLFAPLIKADVFRNAPEDGVGVPVTITRMIQHCWINHYVQNQIIYLYRPTGVSDAISYALGYAHPDELSLRNAQGSYMWGYSDLPGGATDWATAVSRNDGIYARVWRPWDAYPDVYSVQYFVLLTYNQTQYANGDGDHESDWAAVDIAVDARANAEYPTILHMVCHNHGRQHFVAPECIEFEEGHPVVYLENKVNEAWPNAGRGDSWASGRNWPSRPGFACNKNFDYEDSIFVDEADIGRDHTGEGNRWPTWQADIPNVGDNGVSLYGPEGVFFLQYPGRYGDRSEGIFYEGDPPRGPRFQPSMWERQWDRNQFGQSLGPWVGQGQARIPGDDADPFQFPLQQCSAGSPSYSYCLWSGPGYQFSLPARPGIGRGLPFWVTAGAVPSVVGTLARPYESLQTAVSRVPPGSEVNLQTSDPFVGSISRPMTIRAAAGPVTIGQP